CKDVNGSIPSAVRVESLRDSGGKTGAAIMQPKLQQYIIHDSDIRGTVQPLGRSYWRILSKEVNSHGDLHPIKEKIHSDISRAST
ncbi:hypothetical protein J6590_096490, partial [Homalodisca vitripennis]